MFTNQTTELTYAVQADGTLVNRSALSARFDQGHIHRQRIFFHQFYYRVKLLSNEHLTCGFGSYPGLAGKGV